MRGEDSGETIYSISSGGANHEVVVGCHQGNGREELGVGCQAERENI